MTERTCTYVNRYNVRCCTECGLGVDMCQCVSLDEKAAERLTSPTGVVMAMVRDEIRSAREAFPATTHMLAALTEEVGELNQAMIEHDRAQGITVQQVLREAVQVACMGVRVAVEGDDNFLYEFPAIEDELPRGPIGQRFD